MGMGHIMCPSLGWDLAVGMGQLVQVREVSHPHRQPFVMLLGSLLALCNYVAIFKFRFEFLPFVIDFKTISLAQLSLGWTKCNSE